MNALRDVVGRAIWAALKGSLAVSVTVGILLYAAFVMGGVYKDHMGLVAAKRKVTSEKQALEKKLVEQEALVALRKAKGENDQSYRDITQTVLPGGVGSVGQKGGITVGTLGALTIAPETYPGFGMIRRGPSTYEGPPAVFLRDIRLDAGQKPRGVIHVVVLLSEQTIDNLRDNEGRIREAMNAMLSVGTIRVFHAPSRGGYSLHKNGREVTTGANMSLTPDPGVSFFTKEMESVAMRLRDAIGHLYPGLVIRHREVTEPFHREILDRSGLDVEIVL